MNVWKFGGAIINEDLSALANQLGVIVHGGGQQLDAALRALGPAVRIDGLRVTSFEAAQIIRATMDGLGQDLAQRLQAHGLPAVHIPAADQWLHAARHPQHELGRVGAPNGMSAAVKRALEDGQIPVLTPVGFDADGPLNVNADDAAAFVAHQLGAALYLATDVPHVRRGTEALETLTGVGEFIAAGHAKGGMIPKLLAAGRALDGGVPSVKIGTIAGLAAGIGTTVFSPEIALVQETA